MGAKKGNKNALGNEGGKPPFYSVPNEMEERCNKYFENCDANQKPYTITGLALSLGFKTRQSLIDYCEKIEFVDIIKRARLKVECGYEERLFGNSPTGSIFALKNMGWKDKQELEVDEKVSIEWNETKTYLNDTDS